MTSVSQATEFTVNDTLSYSSNTLTDWKSRKTHEVNFIYGGYVCLALTCIRSVAVPARSSVPPKLAKVAETHLGVTLLCCVQIRGDFYFARIFRPGFESWLPVRVELLSRLLLALSQAPGVPPPPHGLKMFLQSHAQDFMH